MFCTIATFRFNPRHIHIAVGGNFDRPASYGQLRLVTDLTMPLFQSSQINDFRVGPRDHTVTEAAPA